ncbi:MAG TPA: NAD(+) synthase [Thermoanaerobaculia bacterium]|nr:NAD(+) synthase [Thermoanaerobaculia bacterium]
MKIIKVAAGWVNQTPLDWDGNQRNLAHAIAAARGAGATIVCLPEMSIPGYNCEDAFLSGGTLRQSWRVLHELLPLTSGLIVTVGLPVLHGNALFNCAAMIVDGRIAGFVAKQHLAGDGIHYEPRWFRPWPVEVRGTIEVDGAQYPIGDLHFDVGGIRIGFEICEDAWVASRPGSRLAQKGIDIILNPSASHFAFGKLETRKRFVLEGSRAFNVTYVYANLLGNEAGRAIYDGGALIASGGRLIAAGPRFSFASSGVTTAAIDIDATRRTQASTGSFAPDLTLDSGERIAVPFEWPEAEPEALHDTTEAWERGAHVKEEEFTRAETLALFDYLRKSRSHGFVVSLSGGADSAACTLLVALALERATAELGFDGVRERLAYVPGIAAIDSLEVLKRRLLLTAYQSTVNSSETTRDAAQTIAAAAGATFYELDVDPLVNGYVSMIEQTIGRELAWSTDDVALQNIQARVRAPGIWLLANLRNALLLATSNRSEAAVGYATMDGDTCGGLSPIAGIDKAFLRSWLRWLETAGPEGMHPVAELAVVNRLVPTAELRPQEQAQTDEDDLMPYPLLDAVERAAIRDKQTPLEVYRRMRVDWPQYTPAQLALWIERFFRLWSRNQWKRERYAPSFHLDDENLDPKTWCRFPILSGGFERELRDLHDFCVCGA